MDSRSKEIWGDLLQSSFDDEVLIYRSLYHELSKKEQKNYPGRLPCFSSIKTWEKHVRGILEKSDISDLNKLLDYLTIKKKIKEAEISYYKLFGLPFCACIAGALIVKILETDFGFLSSDNCITVVGNFIVEVVILTCLYMNMVKQENRRFIIENFYTDYSNVVGEYIDEVEKKKMCQ